MKGTTYRRCGCKDARGKPLNQNCPKLSGRHGTWVLDTRIDVTGKDGRRLKRGGFEKQKAAQAALEHVHDLVKLAADDDRMRRRIGDLIFDKSKRGGQLPSVEEIRRRLGAGEDIAASGQTVSEWLEEWHALKKRRLKKTTLSGYRQHIDHFLTPLLGEIARDKLRPEHVMHMFDRIDEWNDEVRAARKEKREYRLPDDVRQRKRIVGVATQHRILATLRSAYTTAVRRPGGITWNPCTAVELPPAKKSQRTVWSPEQVVTYLDGTADDRLGGLYRAVLLRGLRRGEVLGVREEDLDDDDMGATIAQTILEVSNEIFVDTPKSEAGHRWVGWDEGTRDAIRARRRARRRERLAAGEAWQEHGLIWCQEDGTPLPPHQVSWWFRRHAELLGLPVIRLHDGRHTAATLGLEAGLDIKIVSDQLGHSDTSTTRDLYTHVRKVVHKEAAGTIVQLLETKSKAAETGS